MEALLAAVAAKKYEECIELACALADLGDNIFCDEVRSIINQPPGAPEA